MGRELTSTDHWDDVWRDVKLPSTRVRFGSHHNLAALIDKFAPKNRRFSYCEVGCAPGAWMVYMNRRYGCSVTGIDTSPEGVRVTQKNLSMSNVKGVVLQGNVLSTSLPAFNYDLVGSWGLIEHFRDPLPIIEAQFRLVKPGGITIFTMPNYGGIYGRIEAKLNPDHLNKHDLTYMNVGLLRSLIQRVSGSEILFCDRYGAANLGVLSLHRLFGQRANIILKRIVGLMWIFQPVHIKTLSPMIALVLSRVNHGPIADNPCS